ncbi:unnamed protein product [Arabis nemorensis]|uniref:Uncharacterized protein n=1 Tax=Arabis nemorensis TaxID=586526 RepID=A0A565BBG4_9BRAS|nr:unnamed protein product [Arabis nemorensis]
MGLNSFFDSDIDVCLLYKMSKGKNSFWYPYLVHLPRDYDLSATFGEFEKQALQVEDVVWATEKAIAKSLSEWKEVGPLMKELDLKPKFQSFQAWLWAFATVDADLISSYVENNFHACVQENANPGKECQAFLIEFSIGVEKTKDSQQRCLKQL